MLIKIRGQYFISFTFGTLSASLTAKKDHSMKDNRWTKILLWIEK